MPAIATQLSGPDWLDVLMSIGIVATFVVFAIALVLIRFGKSKKQKSDDTTISK